MIIAQVIFFSTASSRRPKLELAITGASCGAFLLLLVGAIVTYRCNYKRKLKQDQFFDVEGICFTPISSTERVYGFSVLNKFP